MLSLDDNRPFNFKSQRTGRALMRNQNALISVSYGLETGDKEEEV